MTRTATSPRKLAERVAEVERVVAQLHMQLVGRPPVKDWRRTVGMFSGDEVMKKIDEYARQFREADRARARRGRGGRKAKK